jgi:two-component system, chemotaxis family, response regulator Rcp1
MTQATPVRILLVEDSSDDVLLTRKALRKAKVANEVSVASTGERALDYLRSRLGTPSEDTDLVLLDLNLPGMDGHEVLREIKGDPKLRELPVIVLTTSAEQRDVAAAYGSHVNAYVTKPLAYGEFSTAIRSIESFWLNVVQLPRTR